MNNTTKIKLSPITEDGYRDWYIGKRTQLYAKYGKSILAIDRGTHRIKRVFKYSEINESLVFCTKNHLVHQVCDSVFYGETEVFFQII